MWIVPVVLILIAVCVVFTPSASPYEHQQVEEYRRKTNERENIRD